jgi:hypothetical protein
MRNGPESALPPEDAVQRVGARVDLSPGPGGDHGGDSVEINVTLFAESERRHWETRLDDADASFSLVPGDLEDDVRRLVIPHKLRALQQALAKDGVDADRSDLEQLPFVIEVGRQLERELAKRRLGADR